MDTFIGTEQILEKKKAYTVPCSYHFYKDPPQIVRGSMKHLYDEKGKEYLDFFAGVSVMNCGHSNPEILNKTIQQMETLQHTTTIYLTEPMVKLAEKIASIMPGNLGRSFFVNSGSEANEGALLLAKLYTGNSEFIALNHGLHGRTALTMAVTGIGMWRTDPTPPGGIHFAPNAYCYRCPYKATPEHCDMACAHAVDHVISNHTSGHVAGMIAEVIQGNGGIITPPKGYFSALKKVLERHDIPLIVDEVQTGFARTGKWFAFEHYDIIPEVVTVAKALGNGVPIGAYITNDQLAASFTRPSASTLGGNPVSSVNGMAVLDYMMEYELCNQARVLGERLQNGLLNLQEEYAVIGDVRGIGLMQGAEIVGPDKEPLPDLVDKILEGMKERGIFIGKNGESRNVLAFQPPLIINEDDVDAMLYALREVLRETAQ